MISPVGVGRPKAPSGAGTDLLRVAVHAAGDAIEAKVAVTEDVVVAGANRQLQQ